MKIVLTGGGSAGHVTPNLALIPKLLKDGWEIHYIGEENSIEQRLVSHIPGVCFHGIKCGKLRRYFDVKNFTDPFKVMAGTLTSRKLIRDIKPSVVFSKGGFVSVPVVFAARLNKAPIVCHESDMTPGLANKLTSPFAEVMCCTFPEAAKLAGEKGLCTGTPLREEIFAGDRERGLKKFGLKNDRPVLMVTGGSQGAVAINEAVRAALNKLTGSFQILHLCGEGNFNAGLEGTERYVQREYLEDDMADAYACADALVSRAGSNMLCEILALRKPALLIPYPKGASRGDQIDNANSFAARGLAFTLPQDELTPDRLYAEVVKLYKERGALYEAMDAEPSSDGTNNVLKQIYKAAKA